MRVCGESMYAEHSIRYEELDTFFYAFSMWTNDNVCLDWEAFIHYCTEFNIQHVPVLYDGIFDYNKIKEIYEGLDFEKQEGLVCRVADAFLYDEFQTYTAKAVRPAHVSTDEHWKKTWKPNKLKK